MKSAEQIRDEVNRLSNSQPWWHDIELPFGVKTIDRLASKKTANSEEIKWNRIKNIIRLENRSVLDVACNDGYYSLMAERSRASKILAIDIDENRVEKAKFIKNIFGLNKVRVKKLSIYELPLNIEEKFEVVFCLGLLHRVPDPYGLIQCLLAVGNTIIVEWPALMSKRADARFWGGSKKDDFFNTGYWELSRTCLRSILFRLGAKNIVDINPYSKRAIFIISAHQGDVDYALENTEKTSLSHFLKYKLKETKEAFKSFLLNTNVLKS